MTQRVLVSPMTRSDGGEFIAAAIGSKRLHAPWVSPPLSRKAYAARVERLQAPKDFAFLVRRRDSGALAGYIDITNVVRGLFQSGYVSYYAFHGQERQGLMTEGLGLVCKLAFRQLKLHRLEANIQPGNTASMALAAACGFRKEGYSPRYLKIRGRWRDHERWALLSY
jgi:ribosomal-protein-alanine N-acetyltransferase